MTTVALTGANGLVGSRIVELLKDKFEFVSFPQAEMDITNKDQVNATLSKTKFDVFLHLAAYTNVAGAETNKELAYAINAEGTKNVFEVTQSLNKKFIYISTDFVFDGEHPPYSELSIPNPLSVYAQTKYEGEKIVYNNAMIVRIAYPYRAQFEEKKDFFRTFKWLIEQKKQIHMIADSLMTPTFVDDIANGLSYLINNYSPEIFHIVGSQSLSPYDACIMIAKMFNLDSSHIGKTTLAEYIVGKAPLPKLARIVSMKNTFSQMSSFEEGLLRIKEQLKII